VRRWPESPRVEGHSDHCLEHLGAEVIQGGAFIPSLRSAGLRVNVAPSLDGVVDIAVIADLVAREETPKGRLVPSLLLGHGAPGLRAVGATARKVTTASGHRRGMHVGVIPIGDGRWLGWPGRCGTMSGSRALSLLLEGNTKKPPCLVQPLIGLQV
jgi:hypothetical protein